MKALKALLLLPCLCLLYSCQGGSNAQSTDSTSPNVQVNKVEFTATEISEEKLLSSLDEKNLNTLLERSSISKESAEKVLEFYKDQVERGPEENLAEQILIKNKNLILEDLVISLLEKKTKNDSSKKLLYKIGDDSYYTFAKFFAQGSIEDQVAIAKIIKEISKEQPRLREVSECGAKEFKEKEDILCGIKSYNLARAPLCGAESYNVGSDMSCPGSHSTRKQFCKRERGQDYSVCEWGGNDYPASCEAPRFGVKTWKECEDKSFGVAHYNTCTREEFGVKTFNACEIRKTRDELEVYIQGRTADINLNGSLLLSNQALLIKQSRSAVTLACFIEKHANNPLTQDVVDDLVSNFELLTNKTYSRDLAINCEQVISKTENLACLENSKNDMCKTKRSLDAANKYFKENLKEVMLLSQDKIAQIDPLIKERLAELTEQLVEYVR